MSWNYTDAFMPEEFHTKDSFKCIIKMVVGDDKLYTSRDDIADKSYLSGCCIGLGLMLRDLGRSQFRNDPDEPSEYPAYVDRSEANFEKQNEILRVCTAISK
jgi:hypothetical protein